MSRPYQQHQQQQQQQQQQYTTPDNSSNYNSNNNNNNKTFQQSFPTTDGVAKESDPLLASGPRRIQNNNSQPTTTTLRSRRRPSSRSPELTGTGHHLATRNSTLSPSLPVVHYLDKKDRPMIPITTHSTDIDSTQQPASGDYYPPPENDWGGGRGEGTGSHDVGAVYESIAEEVKEENGGNDGDSTTSSINSSRLSLPQQQTPLPSAIIKNQIVNEVNNDVDDEESTSHDFPQRHQLHHHQEQRQQLQQHQAILSQSDHSVGGKSQSTPPPMYHMNKINNENEIRRKNSQQQSTYTTPTDNYNNYNTIDDPYNSIRLSQHEYGGGGGGHNNVITDNRSVGSGGSEQPPLLEIPEEIYAVRKAALQVLKPLNKTWIVISVGFALTVLFGMAKWTHLLPVVPFWFIVLPCWTSHVGLLWLHICSARALSSFIAEANESRQLPDSRDHLNRTEYLPLLQRSLKFGLKTGLLSFCIFLFEVLIYIRVARGGEDHQGLSLTVAFIPLWLLVLGGIIDGLICKSQHPIRVLCWILTFSAMILTVLKVDYGLDMIRWRVVVSPIITVLCIASVSLIYIVYGHQIGYYRLTEAQLTAGNLYSLAALICIVLIVMIGEVIPLSRPVEIETRIFVVILAPLVVCLVGMGAWVISRDEFGRLLLYGGQSAVHPMKLRWEAKGWTSVQGRGVTIVPMFGEVSFQPLEKNPDQQQRLPTSSVIEMFSCCNNCTGRCYPTEDDTDEDIEEKQHLTPDDVGFHPYLLSSNRHSTRHAFSLRGTIR